MATHGYQSAQRVIVAKFTPKDAGPGWCCLRFECGHELLDRIKGTPPIGNHFECPECTRQASKGAA